MSIPLDTYDPNWKERFDIVKLELQAEQSLPYDDRTDHNRSKVLLKQLQEAFHAQFKTTGDYAEFMENSVRGAVSYTELEDFEVPEFPRDNSVETTNRLYTTVHHRLEMKNTMERHQLPLDYPAAGEPFSLELGSDEIRTIGVLSHEFGFPIFEGNDFNKIGRRIAPYGYVMEKRASSVNICFQQVASEDGPSPINCVEDLATEIYNAQFGASALARGEKFYSPEKVNFYIYIPPREYGDESFMHVGLTWDKDHLRFDIPEWNHFKSVPYVLRKQAAAEGLAKDPDAPVKPKTARRNLPRKENG